MTDLRVLRRLGILGAGGLAAYAASLGGVAFLQSQSEAATAAARAPLASVVNITAASNDALTSHLNAAAGTYNSAAAQYAAIDAQIAAVQADLAQLSTTLAPITGGAPVGVGALPKLLAGITALQPPAVHATTGASGVKP